MALLRKSSLAVVLLGFFMVWGHESRAEAQSTSMPLARVAAGQQTAAKKGHLPPELSVAIRLYESLEYETALEQLARGREATWDADIRVLAWLYEGIILANLGHADRSREAFRTGLRLQPSAVLPIAVSPKIALLFQNVRDEVHRETVASRPPIPPPSAPVAVASPPSLPEMRITAPSESEAGASPSSARPEQLAGPALPLPSQEEAALSPPLPESPAPRTGPPPIEPAVSSSKATPGALTSPLNPKDPPSIKSHQLALALGGVIAATGVVLLATMGSASPENQSTHAFAGGAAIVGGVTLLTLGSNSAWVQHRPNHVGSLQRQRASIGARFFF
jgi:hypothetical protein